MPKTGLLKTEIKDNSKLSEEHCEQLLANAEQALFDADFYLANNLDVKKSKLDPFVHFLEYGAKEGRSPHPLFDSSYYFDMAPDRDVIGDNPLLHFLKYGYRQGFNPHPLFDIAYYRQQAGELLGEENPLVHFLIYGKNLRLNPHPLFDTAFYLKNNVDAQKSELNPLLHFLRYGKSHYLTPHPLFDMRFYLSKYPDIKNLPINPLVHFAWRGARERRSPNAKFDSKYYSEIIFPTVVDNPLLHYLEIGRNGQLPTISLPDNSWWCPESIQKLCRAIVYSVFCFFYGFGRSAINTTTNYDHQFSTFKFWYIAMLRFWQAGGAKVKFTVPTYLTQLKKLEPPQPYAHRVYRAPLACGYLYLANVFKIQGFFADAENILGKLEGHDKVRDLALCSLGDLFLVQATWAHEFKNYAEEGIVLNLFPQWKKSAGKHTWHSRTFEQALTVIRKALEVNEKHLYAQWLLCYGLLTARKHADASAVLKKYSGRTCLTIERNILEARASYGLQPKEGIAVLRKCWGTNNQNLNIIDVELIDIAKVPLSVVQEHTRVLESVKLPIESNIVRNLELISCRNVLEFGPSYLSRFKTAEIFPEYGIVIADKNLFIKESCHVKLCHAPLFNSCLQEITDRGALLSTSRSALFSEENCLYIGCNNNYYHWLIDELPRLSLVEANEQFAEAPVLVNKTIASWQYDLLAMLGIKKDRLRKIDFKQPLAFTNLIVPTHLSRDMVAHPQAVSFMRRKLLDDVDGRDSTKGKRIYVTRSAHTTAARIMLNERLIIDKFRRANFQIIDPAQLSIKEQIELFSDAEVIAGPAGAGLTNILFAPKKARVLVLGAGQAIYETYTSLACAIGQASWSVRGISYARPYPYWIWTNFDYEIDEKDIDLCFDHIL